MFTLGSSMLIDDVFFSQGQNTPYDKKYNLHLGKPLGKFFLDSLGFARKFQNGTLHVNPNDNKAWIEK